MLSDISNATTPLSEMPCRLEHTVPSRRLILSPVVYDTPQQTFNGIRIYLDGSICAGTWVSDHEDSHCRSSTCDPEATQALISLCDCLRAACVLVGQGENQEAGLYMNKACSKIETIVCSQEPDMLRSLLDASSK